MVRMDLMHDRQVVDRHRLPEALAGWVETAGSEQVLHPLLRRLLLHALSRRPAGDARSWDAVHDLLRCDYEDRSRDPRTNPGDLDQLRDRAQCHWLALGRVWPVVQHVREILVTSSFDAWLRRLDMIAASPCRPFSGSASDRLAELVTAMSANGDPDQIDEAIAELLLCRWIVSDPLGDPER